VGVGVVVWVGVAVIVGVWVDVAVGAGVAVSRLTAHAVQAKAASTRNAAVSTENVVVLWVWI
jgi:hypothetical protein